MALGELIADLRREGLGIILTTHYMDEAERLSDRMVVLRQGRVAADDTPRAVVGNLVGDHVLVVRTDAMDAALRNWFSDRRIPVPAVRLGEWHVPLSGDNLSAFTADWAHRPFEIRSATLDDLFVHLSQEDAA
jgi:ABC-type multidrug transport system ATPase subunit